MKARLASLLRHELAGGVFLLAATFIALIMANSGLMLPYHTVNQALRLPVNDGLMVIFFFCIGLEIKQEMTSGTLAQPAHARLPIVAALCGMIVPALLFVLVNLHAPLNLRGWAIPAATDIAFALGILSLLGNRLPSRLKVLLLSIAVLDDLGAIAVIALFYTAQLSFPALACAVAVIGVLYALRHLGIKKLSPYLAVSVALWIAVLFSGVHATIAGVIAAFFIPRGSVSILEHRLRPWCAFLIIPLFAFVNAGVALGNVSLTSLAQPLPLGIMLGLFLGKQLGIFGGIWGAARLGFAQLPQGAGWLHIYGLAALCGIGFTMSLFIGMLAFPDDTAMTGVKLGVLSGSLLSALWGLAVLKLASKKAASV